MAIKEEKRVASNTTLILKSSDPPVIKYPIPKILLVDMKDETENILKAEGYNVATGSFGVPYKIPRSHKVVPVIMNGTLPTDFTEQEIIVIDLVPNEAVDLPAVEKSTPPNVEATWAWGDEGMVDPRPSQMYLVQGSFNRIFSHGGVFIIFANNRLIQNLVLGGVDINGTLNPNSKSSSLDNWCFLSILENLIAKPDFGKEILIVEDVDIQEYHTFKWILSEHIGGAQFLCTFEPKSDMEKSWVTLATNKYGAPVAGAIASGKENGLIFIFPQIQNKSRFLTQFFNEVLPEISPHLFPHFEGTRWVQRPEYELPKVLELKNEIERIQQEARRQVVELEKAIEEKRHELGYLHDLISEKDQSLVDTVKKTLEVLGFQSVVDVDEEMKKTEDKGSKREDLQIRDGSPSLLVEVKGISGLPKDAAALQVWKYIAPRMRESGCIDIQGLSIINHQRNLPALDRENKAPFREDILINAEEQKFGLLTTWDLHCLTRNYLKHGWKHEHIKPLFYQSGRIEPVPKHYEFIGVVEHLWEKAGAVGVLIKAAELKRGDRIAFELPVEFEEQVVESLQVDKQAVPQAAIGTLAGIKTHLTKEQAKKGIRVFRVANRMPD